MSEEQKSDCCGPKSGCGCGGAKKMLVMAVLALLIFTCGYVFGKGNCPFGSGCSSKMCPITQH